MLENTKCVAFSIVSGHDDSENMHKKDRHKWMVEMIVNKSVCIDWPFLDQPIKQSKTEYGDTTQTSTHITGTSTKANENERGTKNAKSKSETRNGVGGRNVLEQSNLIRCENEICKKINLNHGSLMNPSNHLRRLQYIWLFRFCFSMEGFFCCKNKCSFKFFISKGTHTHTPECFSLHYRVETNYFTGEYSSFTRKFNYYVQRQTLADVGGGEGDCGKWEQLERSTKLNGAHEYGCRGYRREFGCGKIAYSLNEGKTCLFAGKKIIRIYSGEWR